MRRLAVLAILLATPGRAQEVGPPPAPVRPVVDELHGDRVADPYRWLEDGDAPEVRAWVEAQNAHTRRSLDAFPGRPAIESRLAELLAIPQVGSPGVRGQLRFFRERSGGRAQPILYVQSGGGEPRPLVDPNDLDPAGTTSLDWWVPSPDGALLAYGLSKDGSERSVLHVREIETGRDRPDRIEHCRSASVAWTPDSKGFYYTRHPSPAEVGEAEASYHRRVWFHVLGTDPARDVLVFGEGRDKTEWPSVDLSPNGRHLLVHAFQGWSRSEIFHRDPTGTEGFRPLVAGLDAMSWGQFLGDRILLSTNHEAPRGRLVVVDPARPEPERWRTFLPEGEGTIQGCLVTKSRVVVHLQIDAASRLVVFDHEGRPAGEVALPALGTVSGLAGDETSDEVLFGFSSFFHPPAIHRVEVVTGRRSVFRDAPAGIDPSAYVAERVRYASKDGTLVPMFLVRRKDAARTGDRPTLLTGYGGFNISLTPSFDRSRFLWLEKGGLLAIANLRGGGEYGEAWHRAGMLDRKENTFDDFVAAAEWLVAGGWTRPDRLAIRGGSNGGLLVGVALTRRPDLFRAVVCNVPLLDMLRYHRFLLARLWIPEYGSAEDAESYRWLAAYSPYHHVRPGTKYPAVLLTTAERDTRVDPCHALKMAARLQAATTSGRPVLLSVEPAAGHGAGKPISKVAQALADEWTFLHMELGVE